jgi:hypothetical protein
MGLGVVVVVAKATVAREDGRRRSVVETRLTGKAPALAKTASMTQQQQ